MLASPFFQKDDIIIFHHQDSLRVCLDWGGDLKEWIWSDFRGK